MQFTVDFSIIAQQRIRVSLVIPASNHKQFLRLPNWIPGSYMLRHFAQHVHSLKASNTEISLLSQHEWELEAHEGTTIEYEVFANDLSVRSSFANDGFCFFNGTSVFVQVCDSLEEGIQDNRQYHVNLKNVPEGWHIDTSMPGDNDGYICHSYADLIEHPMLIGQLDITEFSVQNTQFTLAFSEAPLCDKKKLVHDLTAIIEHHFALYKGPIPFTQYHFQTMLSQSGYGGLEHTESTALLYPRNDLCPSNREGYETFLSLCAHELLHAWHVKRIQPQVLKNPSLGSIVNTEQLWIYEGLTSLYDDLSIARAKTITGESYAKILAKNITRLLRNPGADKQTIAQSSWFAWTKFYLQTPTSTNFITSYYNKGGLVALCLDILLRKESKDTVSLDDVMQILWRDYGQTNLGTPDTVIADICRDKLNINVDNFIQQYVYGTAPLPLLQLLPYIGLALKIRPSSGPNDKGGDSATTVLKYDWGGLCEQHAMGIKVLSTLEGGALAQACVLPNDVIVAINNQQCTFAQLTAQLNRLYGQQCELTLFRDGRLLQLTMPLVPSVPDTAVVDIIDNARFEAWLGIDES
ncbi:MAG: M61 family peptidase [Alteromonadaceae bacterium]|nr:M61 family peptidase [Alteromonadaceae bacterium]